MRWSSATTTQSPGGSEPSKPQLASQLETRMGQKFYANTADTAETTDDCGDPAPDDKEDEDARTKIVDSA